MAISCDLDILIRDTGLSSQLYGSLKKGILLKKLFQHIVANVNRTFDTKCQLLVLEATY